MRHFSYCVSLLTSLVLISCSQEREDAHPLRQSVAAAPTADSLITHSVKYSVRTFTREELRDYLSHLTEKSVYLLCKINRRDREHLYPNVRIVIPSEFSDPLLSPFPHRCTTLNTIGKVIFVDLRLQAFVCYSNGVQKYWGPVSSGKKSTPTPPGLYHINWKARKTISTVDPDWVMQWYMNIENMLGISLHQYSLPGYPASHSCIRLLEEDANQMYQWVEQWKLSADGSMILRFGTPVIVYGDYPFGTKNPVWIYEGESSQSAAVNEREIDSVYSLYRSTIETRQHKGD